MSNKQLKIKRPVIVDGIFCGQVEAAIEKGMLQDKMLVTAGLSSPSEVINNRFFTPLFERRFPQKLSTRSSFFKDKLPSDSMEDYVSSKSIYINQKCADLMDGLEVDRILEGLYYALPLVVIWRISTNEANGLMANVISTDLGVIGYNVTTRTMSSRAYGSKQNKVETYIIATTDVNISLKDVKTKHSLSQHLLESQDRLSLLVKDELKVGVRKMKNLQQPKDTTFVKWIGKSKNKFYSKFVPTIGPNDSHLYGFAKGLGGQKGAYYFSPKNYLELNGFSGSALKELVKNIDDVSDTYDLSFEDKRKAVCYLTSLGCHVDNLSALLHEVQLAIEESEKIARRREVRF